MIYEFGVIQCLDILKKQENLMKLKKINLNLMAIFKLGESKTNKKNESQINLSLC